MCVCVRSILGCGRSSECWTIFVSCTYLLWDRKQSIGIFSAVPWHINAHPPERDAMRFAAENRNVTRVMRITVRHIPSRPRRPHTHTKSHLISFSSYCDRKQWNHCLSIELTVHGKWTWIRFRFDLSVMWAFDLIRSNKTTTTKIFRLQSINSLRTLCPNERAHEKSKISTKFDLSVCVFPRSHCLHHSARKAFDSRKHFHSRKCVDMRTHLIPARGATENSR